MFADPLAARTAARQPHRTVAGLRRVSGVERRQAIRDLCTHDAFMAPLRVSGLLTLVDDDDYETLARLAEADDANASALSDVASREPAKPVSPVAPSWRARFLRAVSM